MNVEIVEIIELSGEASHIYSVALEGAEMTLLDDFFEENKGYTKEMKSLVERISVMGSSLGCRREFFKHNEGAPGDGVAVLKEGRFRLYCLYFDRTAIFFGSGGYKPEMARAYQDDYYLKGKAMQMRDVAAVINSWIKEKEIIINEDGSITVNDE